MRVLLNFAFVVIFLVYCCECGSHKYDEDLAKNVMLPLSEIAYSKDSKLCASKILPGLEILETTEGDCGVLTTSICYGYAGFLKSHNALVFAFRGTTHFKQLIKQVFAALLQTPFVDPKYGNVHPMFFNGAKYVSQQTNLQRILKQQLRKDPNIKIYVTGHSLGGAIAALVGSWIAAMVPEIKDNIIIYTFGQPRLGDQDFVNYISRQQLNYYRITNTNDRVSCIPFVTMNYNHVGEEKCYDEDTNTYKTYQDDAGCNEFYRRGIHAHKVYFRHHIGKFCEQQRLKSFVDAIFGVNQQFMHDQNDEIDNDDE